jgi:hypothetical protein
MRSSCCGLLIVIFSCDGLQNYQWRCNGKKDSGPSGDDRTCNVGALLVHQDRLPSIPLIHLEVFSRDNLRLRVLNRLLKSVQFAQQQLHGAGRFKQIFHLRVQFKLRRPRYSVEVHSQYNVAFLLLTISRIASLLPGPSALLRTHSLPIWAH